MSIKSTTIAARVELLSDRIRRLAVTSHIEEQYEEVLILRETLRLASDKARKLRPLRAKDAVGNLAALP
ncbi:hypothetical protein [Bradyrhizobium canariense]|uniref:Uncharacterized protein n=1 Tax=Bradyrhizobium canariense TaxID=255045 RepID=A0A1X3HFX5_9BRAD|nr:hypothetical protein [Bradyrhizobium canariense]OSI80914.1 hypothetical protein BSZ22_00580 [Bradyrhizobium canariense]OSI82583.1 hypothetical protein BSZ23_00785 [Bradyrhizobium canariense]OSI94922.1 hypothetical protein BSZ25_05435 [Bradyrhizobium canariense]OSJ00262.1 hypothetical protein BSZ24_00100 [Bradyrhizobium canariense]OSJ17514.1 hypothetical protein BSZ16_00575 [Bradyrhizobium canariense]